MVNLTKFQLENKLFKLVETNNFKELEEILDNNKDIDIHMYSAKKYDSLISASIRYRCKECFDLIINHPKFKNYQIKPKYTKNYMSGYYMSNNFSIIF